jgi:hypothetical protein
MCLKRRPNEREPLVSKTPSETDSSAPWHPIVEFMAYQSMFKGCRARQPLDTVAKIT